VKKGNTQAKFALEPSFIVNLELSNNYKQNKKGLSPKNGGKSP
jgi:hypothetical protein